MTEEWVDVKGYEGKYQISNLGRVKSLRRAVYTNAGRLWRVHPERILKPCTYKGTSYPIVALSNGKRQFKSHRVHRLMADAFLGATKGMSVDHKDGNKSNNTLENLRLCTHAQNAANKPKYFLGGYSRYKGVTFDKRRNLFIAQIGGETCHEHIGSFAKEEDAAKAYDTRAVELYGEFAYLNFRGPVTG